MTNSVDAVEFCEQNIDMLLAYLGRRWQKTNQEVFELIMSQALNNSYHFTEELFIHFDRFKGNKKDFLLMIEGKQVR